MIIIDKVLTILRSITSIKTVLYQSGFSSNVTLDRKEGPIALTYLMTDYDIDISKGVAKESTNIEIFFCNRTQFDITGDKKDSLMNEMSLIAREFLSKLLADKDIYVVDDSIRVRCSYGKFDCHVAGVSLNLRLEERQGDCIYIEPEPTDNQDGNNEENEG